MSMRYEVPDVPAVRPLAGKLERSVRWHILTGLPVEAPSSGLRIDLTGLSIENSATRRRVVLSSLRIGRPVPRVKLPGLRIDHPACYVVCTPKRRSAKPVSIMKHVRHLPALYPQLDALLSERVYS